MKPSKKRQASNSTSMLEINDPLSAIALPVSAESSMSKTKKYKGANKALRLLLLIESWHAYAEHLILLSKKDSPRRSHALNFYPSRTRDKGIMSRMNLLSSKKLQEVSAVVGTSPVE